MIKGNISGNKPVLLFDGVCNLCNDSVQLVIRYDHSSRIRFASLQSGAGKQLIKACNILVPEDSPATAILIHEGRHYIKSEAVLRTMRIIGGLPAFISYPLSWLPLSFRDRVYSQVSKNRYKWFGKQESCMLPNPELKTRFLPEPQLI